MTAMEWVGIIVGVVAGILGVVSGVLGAGVAIGIMRGQSVAIQKRMDTFEANTQKRMDRAEERIDQLLRNGHNHNNH